MLMSKELSSQGEFLERDPCHPGRLAHYCRNSGEGTVIRKGGGI